MLVRMHLKINKKKNMIEIFFYNQKSMVTNLRDTASTNTTAVYTTTIISNQLLRRTATVKRAPNIQPNTMRYFYFVVFVRLAFVCVREIA